jgi:hypothetical protein
MTSQVHCTVFAAQATLWTIAAGLYFNQGQTAGALLLGGLGSFIVHKMGEKVREEMRRIKVLGPEKFEFSILNGLTSDPLENEEKVKKALARLQNDYPDEYKEVLERNTIFSEGEIVAFFKDKLHKGCCYGLANALFDNICRGVTASVEQSILFLQDEDVYYHQLLNVFLPEAQSGVIDISAKMLVLKKMMDQLSQARKDGSIPKAFSEEDLISEAELMKLSLVDRAANLGRHDHVRNFSDSEKIPIETAPQGYREVFERAMRAFPEEHNVVGVVDLPKHVISFQYGPRGYFLHDSFNAHKGLFEYFDPDTFFSQLREHVLYDVQRQKQRLVKEKKPDAIPEEIRKDAKELLKNIKPLYRMRPLRHINPFLEARELPPVTRALSEGWGAFIRRKLESCIHSFALTSLQALGQI